MPPTDRTADAVDTPPVRESVDTVVIGAGVVGLAIARAMAMAGHEVILLEACDAIGSQTSSRNSEVIHAGLYYPPESLKGRLCVAGKQALYRYCEEHGVPHRRIGKLVVASEADELPAVRSYIDKARANGVTDLQWLEAGALREMEPAVRAVGGFLSPSTGIVDSHALMLSLLGDAEDHGAMLALLSPVRSGRVVDDGIELQVGGDEPMELHCRRVINSAGLCAQQVAGAIDGVPPDTIPRQHLAKAHYYSLAGRSPFNRLIYPVATEAFLGIHVTLDLGGSARFGPDIRWVDAVDYRFDDSAEADYYAAIRRYYPALADGDLLPGYTGIRPKIAGPGEAAADFAIRGPADHGIPGLVSLYGIESPGLTASLAIADEVLRRLD